MTTDLLNLDANHRFHGEIYLASMRHASKLLVMTRDSLRPTKQQNSHSSPLRMTATLSALAFSSAGHAQSAVAGDPQGSGVIIGAMNWLQGTLLGTVATVAAVIAVAMVGFLMLTGRMNWRHGTVVILGCFILFGATSIVAGIRASASGF